MAEVLPLSGSELRLLAALLRHRVRFLVHKVGKLRLKVLPLERILASKQAANRPKDQRVMPVLQNTLLTLQGRRK